MQTNALKLKMRWKNKKFKKKTKVVCKIKIKWIIKEDTDSWKMRDQISKIENKNQISNI